MLVTLSFVPHTDSHALPCAFALLLPLLCLSTAEVLIKVFACSLRGGKCKTHSTIEVGIHAPCCILAEHVFSVEPSGTLPSSLKPLHYWSWTAKPNACRCGSSQHQQIGLQYSCHKAFPIQKQRPFCFCLWILLALLKLHKYTALWSPTPALSAIVLSSALMKKITSRLMSTRTLLNFVH